VADLAARGLGVAVLSESMAAAFEDRLDAVVLDDLGIPAVLALIWRNTPPSPAVAELLSYSRQLLSALAVST
jgi:DNA-binding transcriptional LysR family regulator